MSLSSAPTKIARQQAIAHHQRGRLKEAEQLYRVVLKTHAGHPEACLLVLPWLSQQKFQTLLDLCDVYLDCPSFSGYTMAHWVRAHRRRSPRRTSSRRARNAGFR